VTYITQKNLKNWNSETFDTVQKQKVSFSGFQFFELSQQGHTQN